MNTTTKLMRITLVISSLAPGGAERAMALLANYLAARGHSVHLITLDAQRPDFYTLDPRVERETLDLQDASATLSRAVRNNLLRIKELRKALRRSCPELVISFMDTTNVLTLLATRGLKVKVIVAERTNPMQYEIPRQWVKLRRWLYPRADAVVTLTERVADWVREFVPRNLVHIIPNSIPPAQAAEGNEEFPLPCGHIVAAMGRLIPVKGYDMLLPAFARCAAKHPDWTLLILGDGAERANLTALARELGVSERVLMPGTIQNPMPVLRRADFFVMSSRFEGMPMAVLEALACGLPVVSFDCPTGPREVIRDGIDGLLVPPENIEALATAMDRLMSDPAERRRLAERAPEVLERFGADVVMAKWDALISRVTGLHRC